jgi:hypothetical protein
MLSSSLFLIFCIKGAEGCMYGSGLGSSTIGGGGLYIWYSLGVTSGVGLGFS